MQVVSSLLKCLCVSSLSLIFSSLFMESFFPPSFTLQGDNLLNSEKGSRCPPPFPTPHRVGLFVSLIERRISKQLLSAGINGKRSEWSVTELLAFWVLWIWRALWHLSRCCWELPACSGGREERAPSVPKNKKLLQRSVLRWMSFQRTVKDCSCDCNRAFHLLAQSYRAVTCELMWIQMPAGELHGKMTGFHRGERGKMCHCLNLANYV